LLHLHLKGHGLPLYWGRLGATGGGGLQAGADLGLPLLAGRFLAEADAAFRLVVAAHLLAIDDEVVVSAQTASMSQCARRQSVAHTCKAATLLLIIKCV
jgi:hypothetical protein